VKPTPFVRGGREGREPEKRVRVFAPFLEKKEPGDRQLLQEGLSGRIEERRPLSGRGRCLSS
jgi:hypothetical protein